MLNRTCQINNKTLPQSNQISLNKLQINSIHPLTNQINLTNQPNQPPNPPPNLPALMVNPQQLNWSNLKPEFAGKPEEDAEEHPLRTNEWMENHDFPQDAKVRRFC